jgi:hypothetical protein
MSLLTKPQVPPVFVGCVAASVGNVRRRGAATDRRLAVAVDRDRVAVVVAVAADVGEEEQLRAVGLDFSDERVGERVLVVW